MIFVTVGTHEQPFDRLLRCIDQLKADGLITEEVIMQTGYSDYVPQHCTWSKLLPYSDMDNYVSQARIVITHGGPSSFIQPLQAGKLPIVVPRQARYGEHVNDHQLTFALEVQKRQQNILVVEDVAQLGSVIGHYDELAAAMNGGMCSNNDRFIEGFRAELKTLFL